MRMCVYVCVGVVSKHVWAEIMKLHGSDLAGRQQLKKRGVHICVCLRIVRQQ